jgi:hypothetical protein
LKLLRAPKKLQHLLEMTKISSILQSYEDEQGALASFEAKQP